MADNSLQRVRANGIDVAYRWDGQPADDTSQPILIMAHALGANHRIWDWQIPALADRYRILRYDWRGHGATEAPAGPYTLDQFVADAVALMDVQHIEHAHWIGLSTGGMIGQGLAIAHPQRIASLALCNTMSVASQGYREFAVKRAAIVRDQGVAPIWLMTHKMWFTDAYASAGGSDYQAVREMFVNTAPDGYIGSMQAVCDLNYQTELHRIKVPTLVMAAGDDPVATPDHTRTIAAAIQDAQYVLMNGLRHYSNVEAAAQFNAHLTGFLSGVAGAD